MLQVKVHSVSQSFSFPCNHLRAHLWLQGLKQLLNWLVGSGSTSKTIRCLRTKHGRSNLSMCGHLMVGDRFLLTPSIIQQDTSSELLRTSSHCSTFHSVFLPAGVHFDSCYHFGNKSVMIKPPHFLRD